MSRKINKNGLPMSTTGNENREFKKEEKRTLNVKNSKQE